MIDKCRGCFAERIKNTPISCLSICSNKLECPCFYCTVKNKCTEFCDKRRDFLNKQFIKKGRVGIWTS